MCVFGNHESIKFPVDFSFLQPLENPPPRNFSDSAIFEDGDYTMSWKISMSKTWRFSMFVLVDDHIVCSMEGDGVWNELKLHESISQRFLCSASIQKQVEPSMEIDSEDDELSLVIPF